MQTKLSTGKILYQHSIALGERSYSIVIGENLLADRQQWQPWIGRQVLVVTNATLAPLYLQSLMTGLSPVVPDVLVLPDGEQHKNIKTFELILEHLVKGKHTRLTKIIALGGGVIGDLAGFAAACYQRGVSYIQVPTTLVAQVDSSVGGKTAVNSSSAKNMFGAFHQPIRVVADINTLKSLPEREYRAGLAELFKHAIIRDIELFEWLVSKADNLSKHHFTTLSEAVYKSVKIKMDIVASDERETGLRMLLNFGHTFGHAIETSSGYGTVLHGEAVAIGMVMAANLSVRLGMLDQKSAVRITALLKHVGLPTTMDKSLALTQLSSSMQHDKKSDEHGLRFILLRSIGQAVVVGNVDANQLSLILSQA